MSGGTPRKFAEKIAIMNRKQNEDVSTFDNIMREVRQITSTDGPTSAQPIGIPQQGGLHPPQWNQLGGSLPNVHQLPSYNQQQWPQWQEQQRVVSRSRSPEQHPVHYHPYGRGEFYQKLINRARSDPAIHHASPLSIPTQPMPMSLITGALHPQMPAHQMQPGPSGMTGGIAAGCPMPGCPLPQHPVNPSPLGHISMQNYGYVENSFNFY
uniref:TORC_N domain-containing protein n=1 Tax=Heterorhabditis bacteriophora TaxID=37862 RepID=A0A1I7WM07_HETBA